MNIPNYLVASNVISHKIIQPRPKSRQYSCNNILYQYGARAGDSLRWPRPARPATIRRYHRNSGKPPLIGIQPPHPTAASSFPKIFATTFPFWRCHLTMWWASACLALSLLAARAESSWVNVTVHSTDPRISYAPDSCCRGNNAGGCGVRYEPWELTTYTAFQNRRHSFHQVDSWGNEPSSETMRRRFSFRFSGLIQPSASHSIAHSPDFFAGSAIYIYGAPRDYMKNPPGRQEVCLDGNCQEVKGGEKYEPTGTEPVLLWSSGDLGSVSSHLVELRFLDNGNGWGWWPLTSTSFHHLVYTAEPENDP